MPKIHVLTEDLINKIAAGEVIERPASVVKELIENSLDAKANKITILIEDSGKKLIRVVDNGEGMDETDAQQSVLRHATSKISTTDDLFSISSLGFRGEALASIAAVSQLSIITKQQEKLEGFNLVMEGGKVISSGILGAETGTSIDVKNIFFNTPARKKFLKTDQVEMRHIIDTATRYALINPSITFILRHEQYTLLNCPSVNSLQERAASIYGIQLAKDLMPVSFKSDDLSISGYIGKPHQARNDRLQQLFYINGRWIRNEELAKAMYDAYHSLLFVNKHPVAILQLSMNPATIDVNVHPNKSEVKIEQVQTVKNAVFTAVKETLQQHNLIPTMDFQFEQQMTFSQAHQAYQAHHTPAARSISEKKEAKYSFEPSQQGILPEQPFVLSSESMLSTSMAESSLPGYSDSGYSKLPPMKILGQIHKTFFVAETEGGLLLIDQHVVQERVLYEQFMDEYLNKAIAVQTMLQGEIIELDLPDEGRYREYKEQLHQLGFQTEDFGLHTIILKTIPSVFGRTQAKEMFHDILNSLDQNRNRLEEVQEEIITRMACRASVKAGDTMTIIEIQNLLNQLSKTRLPYTCPHGRSVLIKLDVDELEKKFRRK